MTAEKSRRSSTYQPNAGNTARNGARTRRTFRALLGGRYPLLPFRQINVHYFGTVGCSVWLGAAATPQRRRGEIGASLTPKAAALLLLAYRRLSDRAGQRSAFHAGSRGQPVACAPLSEAPGSFEATTWMPTSPVPADGNRWRRRWQTIGAELRNITPLRSDRTLFETADTILLDFCGRGDWPRHEVQKAAEPGAGCRADLAPSRYEKRCHDPGYARVCGMPCCSRHQLFRSFRWTIIRDETAWSRPAFFLSGCHAEELMTANPNWNARTGSLPVVMRKSLIRPTAEGSF